MNADKFLSSAILSAKKGKKSSFEFRALVTQTAGSAISPP
jgi:hypothetical protein